MRTFVEGDQPLLKRTCRKNADHTVIDLTGYQTAKLYYRIEGGAELERTMTFLTPRTNGEVEYQFVSGEMVEGKLNARIGLVDAAGRTFWQDPPIIANIAGRT